MLLCFQGKISASVNKLESRLQFTNLCLQSVELLDVIPWTKAWHDGTMLELATISGHLVVSKLTRPSAVSPIVLIVASDEFVSCWCC